MEEEDKHSEFATNITKRQLQEVLRTLCVAGTKWSISPRGLCEMHRVVFEGGEKRLKITGKITSATVAKISQENNIKRVRSVSRDTNSTSLEQSCTSPELQGLRVQSP
ncbi:hypothetical protein L484_021732 [Morus notabilis]|uniref:Uncharacterized protein n=1 Tax=Morus notabilis TaxID=981085 RepID=W9S6Z5_9ROSA|nr:hypothetical protein L484_021732 [Morus notabilis]